MCGIPLLQLYLACSSCLLRLGIQDEMTSKLSICLSSQTLDNTSALHVPYRGTSSRQRPPYFVIMGLNSQYTWDVQTYTMRLDKLCRLVGFYLTSSLNLGR